MSTVHNHSDTALAYARLRALAQADFGLAIQGPRFEMSAVVPAARAGEAVDALRGCGRGLKVELEDLGGEGLLLRAQGEVW